MSLLYLELDSNARSFEPGAELVGVAAWQLDKPAKSIELRLCWTAAGKGTPDLEVVETRVLMQETTMDKAPFRFQLPKEPYSFAGRLIAIEWFLDLVVLPSKESKDLRFIMAPGGKEVRL